MLSNEQLLNYEQAGFIPAVDVMSPLAAACHHMGHRARAIVNRCNGWRSDGDRTCRFVTNHPAQPMG